MDQFRINNADLSLKQRIDLFKTFLLESSIDLIQLDNFNDDFTSFTINLDGKKFKLNLLLKNVVNSGWADKPLIKRIQVKAMTQDQIPINTELSCSMFCGFSFVNDEPILSVWNPFMYVFHKTNRSCYVNCNTLALCARDGYIKSVDSNQEVLNCNKNNLKKLILEFINRNAIE